MLGLGALHQLAEPKMNVEGILPGFMPANHPPKNSFLLTSGQEEGQRRLKVTPAPQPPGTLLVSGRGADRALEGRGWARMSLFSFLQTVGHLGLARWPGLSVHLSPQTFLVVKGVGLPLAAVSWGFRFSPSALTSTPSCMCLQAPLTVCSSDGVRNALRASPPSVYYKTLCSQSLSILITVGTVI